jgi:hypothetical protein
MVIMMTCHIVCGTARLEAYQCSAALAVLVSALSAAASWHAKNAPCRDSVSSWSQQCHCLGKACDKACISHAGATDDSTVWSTRNRCSNQQHQQQSYCIQDTTHTDNTVAVRQTQEAVTGWHSPRRSQNITSGRVDLASCLLNCISAVH